MNFIDQILQGSATVSELDEKVKFWHSHDTKNSLQEFLGLSTGEAELWLKSNNSAFNDIVYCRKNHVDIKTYLKEKGK
ncbi:hypothetical protein [Caproiciproducens galactitolivorans]|uniref:Uncharacterized protein n=1 Tax=Caproiciproducens galactitolivorans TaxID=642589 RepID=A0ABT4BR66_9FIRM|nr:hypothetical protein [Caproiciproducens galactitolivorans]MCY1713386.1 hypothetical protein [Caproiciproducens galactitolivorans]